MSKRFRFFLVLLTLVVSGVFLWPTFSWYFLVSEDQKTLASGTRDQIYQYATAQADKDLKTLTDLVNENPTAAVPKEYRFLVSDARSNYRRDGESVPKEWTVENLVKAFSKSEVFDALESHYRDTLLGLKEKSGNILQLGLDLSGGMSVLLTANMDSLAERLGHNPTAEDRADAVNRVMEILNNRIDKFGVSEPSIRKSGDDQISVEIPGAADPERVNAFLMGKGSLSFHMIDTEATTKINDLMDNNPANAGRVLGEDGQPKDPNLLGAGLEVLPHVEKDSYGIDRIVRYQVVKKEVGLDGQYIQSATVGTHPITGKPVINFQLTDQGGEIFYQLTSANKGKSLAIVLDDKVKAGARISEAIRSNVQMTGFSREEASDLALVLRTAALPVDLEITSQQAIGASLGQDSIRVGLRAITLGFLLVIVFMLVYYKGSGVVADIALILNLVLIVAILSAFNLTLTLTSIAGLILTVGMAVDANVIIFERIKEELKLGKSPDAAVRTGFQKAFWTVMDANITTFIAAIFLSMLGSGPVKGFAYTLAVGIVSSMFTALFVSRLMFDFAIDQLKIKRLSIAWRK